MSRVDEALRRAAEQHSRGSSAVPLLAPEQDPVPSDSALDPFPIEIGERRHSRRSSEIPAAPPADGSNHRVTLPSEMLNSGSLLERVDASLAEKIVVDESMSSASREQYRRLAATLFQAQITNGVKAVMVTSAVPGEGKTLTSSNLALTLSESYDRNVLLIDADLRRPAIHLIFRLGETSGLSEGLSSEHPRKLSVRHVSRRLAILPAGQPTSDPMAGLSSDRMRQVVEEARASFDWVIIDTPPLALLPDANLLASLVDGALLVVKAQSTPYELVRRAAEAIGRHRTLGVVLNQAERPAHLGGYDYFNHYYYGGRPSAAAQS